MDLAFPTGVGVNRSAVESPRRFHAFPTGVGVNRKYFAWYATAGGIPHRRGGEPYGGDVGIVCTEHSPQAWG